MSDNKVTVMVYYHSLQPMAKLTFSKSNGCLDWLQESMDLVPAGKYFRLIVTTSAQLRQLKHFFPQVAQNNRHLRFREILRKKATRKPNLKITKTRHVYTPQPITPQKRASFAFFRPKWVERIYQFTLSLF